MSYIPNSVMPHAVADEDEADIGRPANDHDSNSRALDIDWNQVRRKAIDEARVLGRMSRDLGQRGYALARRRPREAAAAGAAGAIAVLAGLAYSAWRGRRSRLAHA